MLRIAVSVLLAEALKEHLLTGTLRSPQYLSAAYENLSANI